MQFLSERRFVNVDTTTPLGIHRAKQLGLAESGLADIISSPLFPEIIDIMNEQHREGECLQCSDTPLTVQRACSITCTVKPDNVIRNQIRLT
jgi:hypothetical protein